MMLFKKQYRNNSDIYYYSFIRFGFIILLQFLNLKTSLCEPISGLSQTSSASSSSSSASSALTGGTWTLRAIPHQSATTYSTLYEQIQNLKYQWESSIDHVMRKIELFESKIGRLDTSNQLRLEKLTESVNSKEIKDELAMEQLMRKLDANYERLNHKIGYMETRLDTTLNKMQNTLDNGFNRIEAHQNDIDTELTDINQSVEEIKTLTVQMEDKHNTTQKSMQHHFQTIMSESASRDQLEKLTGTIQHIGVKLNDTNYSINPQNQNQNQNDASGQTGPDADKITQTIKTEIDNESHRIENKISNMYNDLWRRFMSLEMTVKTVLTYGNTTRRQFQEDIRTLLQQYDKQKNAEPDSQENYIEVVMDAVMSTMQELTRKVDSNFQMVMTSQNLFLDNCHRLQLEEPQLETKISIVLEKILSTITNKTMRFDNRLVETMEMLKAHQSQVLRSLGHTTKMLVSLAEETNEEKKNLESALLELAERNTIVSMTIQELQEDIEILTNVTSVKLNNEIEDWFNKTMIDNNSSHEYDSEEILHKTIEEQSSTESIVSFNVPVTPILTNIENIMTNNKNIKFPDTDEVLKIFTEGDSFNQNNSETERLNDKKISIIIPHSLYNSTENNSNVQNITRSKLYRILLQDIFNQTNEPLNVEEVGAIILNTESDRGNNCTNERESCDDNNSTKSFMKEGKLINITNNETSLEDQNEMIDYINKNSSEIINFSSEDITDIINNSDKLINYNKNRENNTESNINTKIQNITEMIKNKLNSNRNQKYKSSNQDTNQNKTVFQFIQHVTQNQNNNMKKMLEQYNKKRKLRNLLTKNKPKIHNESKQLETLNTRTLDENIITQNVTPTNDQEVSQEVKLDENLQSDIKDTDLYPEKINSEQFLTGDIPSQLSNEFINTDDNTNFYDSKNQNTDADLINPYMTDLKDQY